MDGFLGLKIIERNLALNWAVHEPRVGHPCSHNKLEDWAPKIVV